MKRPSTHKEIQVFRRTALLRATLKSIAKHGFDGTTVQTISDLSGGSRGLVNHHFKSKDDLLVEAYRYLNEEWSRTIGNSMREAGGSAYIRLRALVESSFRSAIIDRKLLAPYLSYWNAAQHSKSIRAVHIEIVQQYRARIAGLFERAAEEKSVTIKAFDGALGLLALIDGFWIQLAVDPKTFPPMDAVCICQGYIDHILGIESAKSECADRAEALLPDAS